MFTSVYYEFNVKEIFVKIQKNYWKHNGTRKKRKEREERGEKNKKEKLKSILDERVILFPV